MSIYMAEFLGTMMLIWLGDGVVASVALNKSKGKDGGWIVVTAAWGLAVAIPAYIFGGISGAHMNPAVTIGNAIAGNFPWANVAGYIIAQMLGDLQGQF